MTASASDGRAGPRAGVAGLPGLPQALCGGLILAAAAAAWGMRPLTPRAPEFPQGAAWINSRDMALSRLEKRRVVVVSFINVFSLNSVRTFEALKSWWERYSQDGLMVIGVHTPDFLVDRDINVVRQALRRHGVRFPVVIDNDRAIWKAYENEGWPAHYLVDHRGNIVHDRLGEGAYTEFEHEILRALEALNGYQPPPGHALLPDPPAADCGESTPLSYAGSRRGKLTSLERVRESQRLLIANRDGEMSYKGKWTLGPEDIMTARENPGLTDYLRLIYRGAESMALMSRRGGRPATVFVKQDEMWLHANNAGTDVQWDIHDRSFVVVKEARLYSLTRNKNDHMHEMLLYPADSGLSVYGFDFSNFCQSGHGRE